MKLYGDILNNMRFAIQSAQRLREHRVHPDTIQFWKDLLSHARGVRRKGDERSPLLDVLIAKLETELAERKAPQP
jgi:hypothetical protein